ncbi:uncharacterized protein BO80DRAFT_356447 [Aspergillus ibericus CBS 121593]|uniref:Arb2 domain-containing protein n=1 Tax=Aspergillus ibericus CBS 121593 TaxID=1448316 RepID=A0A395H1E8_9EURO|nr:hypothetical protein BO80DRAFT_356447 [Aspergillus ibericus CBS 121593]RAL00678.1 hypothetical protein BO80DRAFT_356447 [Aspergillus ibericus CBS 121593]
MFVFNRKDLPADPVFPADLKKLGYFINDNDQIRKISDPEQEFQYKINKHERWNDMQREAMNTCIRRIVSARLRDLGLVTLRLPLTAKPTDAHVPILVSKNISSASRVIVVFGEPLQDLGIWAYRTVGKEGIDLGSAVAFAQAVLSKKDDADSNATNKDLSDTALVLANTGQLIWHCRSSRAMTLASWPCMPRESAVDSPPAMSHRNKIPGNGNWQEHVNCVFDEILAARGRFVRADAKIGVVGLVDGGLGAIRYLANNWEAWRPYISAICLSHPLHLASLDLGTQPNTEDPSSFAAFISSRCRGYMISNQPVGLPVASSHDHGCNCYSSGEALNIECIMPQAWKNMLEWLDQTFADPNHCEARLVIREFSGNGLPEGFVDEEENGGEE